MSEDLQGIRTINVNVGRIRFASMHSVYISDKEGINAVAKILERNTTKIPIRGQ